MNRMEDTYIFFSVKNNKIKNAYNSVISKRSNYSSSRRFERDLRIPFYDDIPNPNSSNRDLRMDFYDGPSRNSGGGDSFPL